MIREAGPDDHAAIAALLEATFEGPLEAALVTALRADRDMILELVAADGAVYGHVAFSRLAIEDSPARAAALAPLAVAAERRRTGTGAALVRAGIEILRRRGADLVLVLGDPAYYGRFGFTAAAAEKFATPYPGPAMQALALTQAGAAATGNVAYPKAFSALD
jgi:putative acetyltransferase